MIQVSQEPLQFQASDAWLLLAILIAAGDNVATLDEIIAAGDCINHAIFTNDEMDSGLYRLTRGGYVEEVDGRFRPSEMALRQYQKVSAKKRAILDQMESLREFLAATAWVFDVPFPRPENRYTYPGFTKEKMAAAVEKYCTRAEKIIGEIDKKRRKKSSNLR